MVSKLPGDAHTAGLQTTLCISQILEVISEKEQRDLWGIPFPSGLCFLSFEGWGSGERFFSFRSRRNGPPASSGPAFCGGGFGLFAWDRPRGCCSFLQSRLPPRFCLSCRSCSHSPRTPSSLPPHAFPLPPDIPPNTRFCLCWILDWSSPALQTLVCCSDPPLTRALLHGCFWAGPHSLQLPFIANLGTTVWQG